MNVLSVYMRLWFLWFIIGLFSCTMLLVQSCSASVMIHATRLIYSSNARDVNIEVSGEGDQPSLVQLWVDDGDPTRLPENSNAPFLIIPPVARINPGQSQSFRITALPHLLEEKKDQESLFWLNILDIPAKPKTDFKENNNYLQLAIRSRIKVFFRPKQLDRDAASAAAKIRWHYQENILSIENPTPYFVIIKSVLDHMQNDLMPQGLELKPFVKHKIKIDLIDSKQMSKYKYVVINDFGSDESYPLMLNN